MLDEFSERSNDISLIYNGFDEDDFKGLTSTKNEKFTIAYIGNFKPNQNTCCLGSFEGTLTIKA